MLLLKARSDSSSHFSRQTLSDVINQRLPTWFRTHKSAPLLYGIGKNTSQVLSVSWEHGIELFTHLDNIVMEMCRDPEEVEGLDEETVERWRKLRLEFTQKTRGEVGLESWRVAPDHLQLPDSYFDNLLGHGPLPALLKPQRHPSSSVVADSLGDPLTV